MDDSVEIKACISRLNKQLGSLEVDLDKLTGKPLDEQLLLLNDEKARLDLTNKYAYVLSSLMFSYMKVLNVKDMAPIRAELARVKSYMEKAKALDGREAKEADRRQKEQNHAKKMINSALDGRQTGAAISKVNFQGKHTRFETTSNDDDEEAERGAGVAVKRSAQENKGSRRNTRKRETHKVSKRKG